MKTNEHGLLAFAQGRDKIHTLKAARRFEAPKAETSDSTAKTPISAAIYPCRTVSLPATAPPSAQKTPAARRSTAKVMRDSSDRSA